MTEIEILNLEQLLHRLYECISGNSNADRKWDEYASYFLPTAQLNIVNQQKEIVSKTVQEYIDDFISIIGDVTFFEKDVSHRIERVDSFAVVWSDYEARRVPDGEVIYAGTNCFQFLYNGKDWKVISLLWERKVRPQHLS